MEYNPQVIQEIQSQIKDIGYHIEVLNHSSESLKVNYETLNADMESMKVDVAILRTDVGYCKWMFMLLLGAVILSIVLQAINLKVLKRNGNGSK